MFERELRELEEKQLLRSLVSRGPSQGTVIVIHRKKYLNFSSNDYLGLANNATIVRAAERSLRKYALGAGASRLLAGGSGLHRKLEEDIARFKGTESALLLNSGYTANTGVIPAIAAETDALFSDELNHASIIDGCRLSRAKTFIFRHRDMAHLRQLLKCSDARRKVVVTEGVFSMDGDMSPVSDIYEICRDHGAFLYLDDAHGTGVLGCGRGTLAHFGLRPGPWILQMGTFSKAFGVFGAFVAGNRDVIEWISNTARSFLYSTALPACVVAAADAAIRLVAKRPMLVERLWDNRERLFEGLKSIGHHDVVSQSPVLTVRTAAMSDVLRLSEFLFRNNIYVPAIRPPTVRESRLRITVTAAHTGKQIDTLVAVLQKADIGGANQGAGTL